MRILAIRGANLASLAEGFAIDFDSEPLRSAGLFAITGETGAGKSTILDAICLALYDKFPRVVAAGASEGAPDPSGETLGSGDPRTILRRGAGRGFAEVDFIGKDGLRYRARCDLQRARGRASGALQKRVRSLWRIDEAGEIVAPVESGIEPVNARVVELTDLTFDQFRRTALLAQGEFDAFLRADAKERAELLEKITGAEIYGVLSQRAFERAREAQQATTLVERRRAEIGVMSEDERAAIDADVAATEAERAQVAERRSAMADALRRFDALAQAHAKLAQAMSAREGALRAFDEMAPRRETLAALAQVEPLRAPRDEMRRAEETQKAALEDAADAKAKAGAAQEAFAAQEARARSAAEAVAASEAEMARFAPIWTEAAALDARIANLAQEEAKARSVAEGAASRAAEKRDERAETMERRADIEREKETALADLARLEPARALSERWRDIDDWLTKRAEISQAKRACDGALAAAFADIDRGDATLADFNARDAQDRAACEKLAAQIADRDGALLALDEPAALARADDLARAVELIEALRRCARTFDEADVAAASAHQDIARYAQDEAAVRQKLEGIRSERARQAAQSAEAERFGELADAAADPHALRLRAALNDDAPCPVCGAREHPFAETHDAASALIEALRARRDESRRTLSRLDEETVSLSARAAQAQALHDDASRRAAQAQAARGRAEAEYASLLSADCARDMAPELAPPTSILSASPRLQVLTKELATARDGVAQKLRAARRLREERDRLRAERDAVRQALDARQEERAALAVSLEALREARARSRAEGAGLVERLESLDRSLAPYLQLCDLSAADLDRDAASARRRLETAGAHYREALARSDEVAANLAAIGLKAERVAAEADSACAREAEAKGDHEARARSLTEARDARALLLEGEATAAHRSRIEARHRAAIAARDEARQRLAEAQQSKTACETRHAHCASAAESAAARAEQARAVFAMALAGAGFDEATAAPLLATSREEQAELRRAVRGGGSRIAPPPRPPSWSARRTLMTRRRSPRLKRRVRFSRLRRKTSLVASTNCRRGSARCASVARRTMRRGNARQRSARNSNGRAQTPNSGARSMKPSARRAATSSAVSRRPRRCSISSRSPISAWRCLRRAMPWSARATPASLGLQIIDRDLGDERRSTRSLSGGERFLASLALALALAGLEGRDSFVDTLFIDEGFGALDSATLDVVIDALETLQGQGRRVGVISHVDSLQQRIATKICVERRGGGISVVRLRAPGYA